MLDQTLVRALRAIHIAREAHARAVDVAGVWRLTARYFAHVLALSVRDRLGVL